MPDICPPRLRYGTVHSTAQTVMDEDDTGTDSILRSVLYCAKCCSMSWNGNVDGVKFDAFKCKTIPASMHQNKEESQEMLEQIMVHSQREVQNFVTTALTYMHQAQPTTLQKT